MKGLVASVCAFLSLAALSSAAAEELSISLEDRDGAAVVPSEALRFSVERSTGPNGVETWACRLRSEADGERFVRIVASGDFRADGPVTVYDGETAKSVKAGKSENPVLTHRHFPLVAAWSGGRGVAMALGAEDHNSFASFRRTAGASSEVRMELVVNAALLRKGATYACTFHRFAFSPKYGIREAYARYYPLYPRRFFRDPAVDPRIYGISAGYAAWKHADAETTRLGHADWDWCYAAGRSWGDALNQAVPTKPRNSEYSYDERLYCGERDGSHRFRYNAEESVESWDALIAERLGCCRYCNVAGAFYMMMLSNISKAIAKDHPDSLETENPVVTNPYPFAPSAFTFPECSWGREARRQLAALAKKQSFEAVAFDVGCSAMVYRGERLKEMTNVGFDEFGAGMVRGVGSARFFDFVRTLPVKGSPYRVAVAENSSNGHVSDGLYADMRMAESAPWDRSPPFPLDERLAAGEKGLTLWEYDYESFDPDYRRWPKADLDQFKRDLIRFSMQRSFYAGVQLPVCTPLIETEYGMVMSEALSRCVKAAWKPVVGAKLVSKGKEEIARFGSGEQAYLAVNNPVRERRRMAIEVFPSEIDRGFVGGEATEAIAFAPYFGGKAGLTLDGTKEEVSFIAGPQLVTVLEAVGRVRGSGRLAIGWEGTPGLATLTVVSKDFTGELRPRAAIDGYAREGAEVVRLAAGDEVKVVYRDAFALAALEKTEGASQLTVSDDEAGVNAADAVNLFLRRAGAPEMSVRKSAEAAPGSIVIGSLVLSAPRQPELPAPRQSELLASRQSELLASRQSELLAQVRRLLDVWQTVRYPAYRPGVPLEKSERESFVFRR